ncbi:MAG: hypothetical protein CBD16_04820 [Betaproteobacteria bacterium TMED156]|nr:MAG: hypothetical protein CBD16_04820 [Betaproteobacteria bacterium TMED156]
MSSVNWKIEKKINLEAYTNDSFDSNLENTNYDYFISDAVSYFPWLYLANYNFAESTKILLVNSNQTALDFQKWFLKKYKPNKNLTWKDIVTKFKEENKDLAVSNDANIEMCNKIWNDNLELLDKKWDSIVKFSYTFINKSINDSSLLDFNYIKDAQKPMICIGSGVETEQVSFIDFLNSMIASNQKLTWEINTPYGKKSFGPNSSILDQQESFYIPIDVPKLDCEKVLQEIQALEENNLFTPLRTPQYGENNPGWSSFAIHGANGESDKILAYKFYGFKSDEETSYRYTDMAKKYTPTLVKYFEENKIHGHENYHRVRIMKLAPKGYISMHDDDPRKNKKPWDEDKGRPSSLNMCINNPDGCEMHFWNQDFQYVGPMEWKPNDAYTLRIHWPHMVRNLSNEPRYHLIVHGRS